ncbi:hypothetical protein AHAS_Ahas01G0151700 [Arachis hypogaea]
MVVQNYVEEGVHRHVVVGIECHVKVHHNHCLGMHHGMVVSRGILEGLLIRGLIKSLWLLPSLIVPTMVHVVIIISSSCNIIITTLVAKGVRVHSRKEKQKLIKIRN